MRIFLMGFMGSGKTSVGKKIAHRKSLPFLDLDEVIETAEGRSIDHMFENGHSYFREREAKYLRRIVSDYSSFVLALGGGTPCFSHNLDIIRANGVSIYLKLSEAELFSRLKENRGNRPLIKSLTDDQLKHYIDVELEQRSVFYEKADIVVSGIDLKGSNIDLILDELDHASTT